MASESTIIGAHFDIDSFANIGLELDTYCGPRSHFPVSSTIFKILNIGSCYSFEKSTRILLTFSIVASNLNYDLDLNGDNYTTMGDYTITQSGSTDGVSIPEQTSEFTNVSGSGNYTINGDVISVSGSFFELELDGVMMADISGPAEANWSINGDGQLTFSQNQNITQDIPGLTSTTSVVSTSVWERR